MNGYHVIEATKLWDWREKLLLWTGGIPADIWVSHTDVIESTIDKLQLSPLDVLHYPPTGLGQQAGMTGAQFDQADQGEDCIEEKEKMMYPIFPGGLKCPHLHFKRRIYILNDEQWGIFSQNIIDGFKDKLSRVGTVGFKQLIETSDAIDALA